MRPMNMFQSLKRDNERSDSHDTRGKIASYLVSIPQAG